MKKPKLTGTPDPKLTLIALNLLIEAQAAQNVPHDILEWVKSEIVDAGVADLEDFDQFLKRTA